MNLHALPALAGAVANVTLGATMYARKRGSRPHRTFALLALLIGLWNLHLFGLFIAPDETFAMNWTKFFAIGLLLIPAVFLQFVLALGGGASTGPARRIAGGACAVGLALLLVHWAGHFVEGFERTAFQYVPRPGTGYYVFIGYFFLTMGFGVALALAGCHGAPSRTRSAFRYLLVAALLGFAVGSTNLLLSFGVRMYPVGHLGGITFTGIVAYGMGKYA